ncbi:MAG: NAD(P)/FAD-dependent oxidoreductase [Parachlamydiaceae bacterium]|nr:NAD(P)/FAD-dependent oxidoreductase [Parachlamydiaceae bacterium]
MRTLFLKIPKVIIIGLGFGGLNAAKALKRASVQLLLIDKSNHHLFQPLLYQVATSALTSENIAIPIRQVVGKQKNTKIILAEIKEINKEKKEVIAENGDRYSYDYLILAPGANHSYFNHPEWEEWAPGLKTLADAVRIREKILLSYERAERSTSKSEAAKFMRFVIIGAGPTGVEMAGAIAEMAHQSLIGNFRNINPIDTEIYLIEGLGQILSVFPKDLADKAQKDLEALGVHVLLNSKVTKIASEGVWIGDRFLESSNIIWAAGNEASPLLKSLGIPLDNAKRVVVNPDLSIPNFSDIFVIGDAACTYGNDGKPLPGMAPIAIQQGRYVAKIIRKKVSEENWNPFVYFDKGMMATIGKNKAIAVVGKRKLSGRLAWLAWCFVHIFYLISFSNRILVILQWFFLYLSNKRRASIITKAVTDRDEPLN